MLPKFSCAGGILLRTRTGDAIEIEEFGAQSTFREDGVGAGRGGERGWKLDTPPELLLPPREGRAARSKATDRTKFAIRKNNRYQLQEGLPSTERTRAKEGRTCS